MDGQVGAVQSLSAREPKIEPACQDSESSGNILLHLGNRLRRDLDAPGPLVVLAMKRHRDSLSSWHLDEDALLEMSAGVKHLGTSLLEVFNKLDGA